MATGCYHRPNAHRPRGNAPQFKVYMEKYIENQINEWLENKSSQFREAVTIARRNSNNGDFYAIEVGYSHQCAEPEKTR